MLVRGSSVNERGSDLLASRQQLRGGRLIAAGLVALLLLGAGVVVGRSAAPGQPLEEEALPRSAGASRVVEGVPVGYVQSEPGAVAAAGNFSRVLGEKANFDPAFGERAYPIFTVPEVRDDLLRRARGFAANVEDAAALANDPGVTLRGVPLGYRVESYTPSEATVSVWYAAIGVGTPEVPMSTAWGTDRLTLVWADGDWKISAISSAAGPEPPSNATARADSTLAASINGFTPFSYLGDKTR